MKWNEMNYSKVWSNREWRRYMRILIKFYLITINKFPSQNSSKGIILI